jgi:hypothetical protein
MLRHLNNQEMLAIASTWSTHPDARATFLSIPDIAPLHPKVVAVHADLLAIQPPPDTASAAIKALLAEAAKVDVDHDARCRAVSAAIEADRAYCLVTRPPQRARAEKAAAVHAKLFPTGLAIVNVSLLAEAGNAARVEALLEHDPTIAEYLESIPLREGRTALDLTRRWLAAGKKLARLEHERSVLAAKEATKPADLAAISVVRARWLRLVTQVLSALELSDADAEAIEIIRGPVRLASDRAGRRYASGGDASAKAVDGGSQASDAA